jgi:hypothetical protein
MSASTLTHLVRADAARVCTVAECIGADAPCPRGRSSRSCGRAVSTRTLDCVRGDASVLPPGNLITDAIVQPSHERLNGHRPTVHPSVCPSVIVRVTTLGPVTKESKRPSGRFMADY